VIDDGPGKPMQIWNVTGQRQIVAAGNSDGDLPVLAFAGGPSSGSHASDRATGHQGQAIAGRCRLAGG
jgi:hypothetical protein